VDSGFLLAGALTAGAYFDGRRLTSRKSETLPIRFTGAPTGNGR